MKTIIVAISALILTSCLTEKKVNKWLGDHRQAGAKYCADEFPPDTLTKTVTQNIDSAGYFDAYMNMSGLADSLFWRLDSLQQLPGNPPVRLNIDSLRKVVDKEIRKRLTPCLDTVIYITNTVVDKAKETVLQGLISDKDQVITGQQKNNLELQEKLKKAKKWMWWFWGLVAVIGLGILAKVKKWLPI